MQEIKKSIVGITLGIRFSRSFRIPDMSGEIIDNILNDPNSPFDNKFFPKITETSSKEKTLYNNNGENLKITSDDFIVSIKVDNNFEEKFNFLSKKVTEYFYSIFDLFSIENINRVGVLFYCDIENTDISEKTIDLLTNKTVDNLQNFSMSFSQKKQTTEGLIKKGVKDYINIIYGLNKNKEVDKLEFNFDYQKFFIPALSKLSKANIDDQLKKALSELETTYSKWLSSYDKQ
ncbi:MAG: hypothetical protein K9M44_00090 [Candidatus Pacebacteria bacterium]|nr:hypothetical protein [Candidatus Paceibacterota bacterium]